MYKKPGLLFQLDYPAHWLGESLPTSVPSFTSPKSALITSNYQNTALMSIVISKEGDHKEG